MKTDLISDVLLIVDFQNDFVTGSLAVPEAEDLIPIINRYIKIFRKVVLSKDKHKINHPSFAAQGGLWPDHCVDSTFGAEIHSELSFIEDITPTINKGYDEEALSAFERTDMAFLLKSMQAKRLFVCGLATDYCVKATVLDALRLFDGEVYVLHDAIRAVNIKEDDGIRAIEEMGHAGAIFINSSDLGD